MDGGLAEGAGQRMWPWQEIGKWFVIIRIKRGVMWGRVVDVKDEKALTSGHMCICDYISVAQFFLSKERVQFGHDDDRRREDV